MQLSVNTLPHERANRRALLSVRDFLFARDSTTADTCFAGDKYTDLSVQWAQQQSSHFAEAAHACVCMRAVLMFAVPLLRSLLCYMLVEKPCSLSPEFCLVDANATLSKGRLRQL